MFVHIRSLRTSKLLFSLIMMALMLVLTVTSASAQDGDDIIVDFTPYEGNPVLTRGEPGEWDAGTILLDCVVYHEDQFHMFYSGQAEPMLSWGERELEDVDPIVQSIGYATSDDGFIWTKHPDNPIFTADESLYPYGLHGGPCWIEEDQWVMLGHPRVGNEYKPNPAIVRMTAPVPTGPWTLGETVLDQSENNRFQGIHADKIIHVEDEYLLYYSALRIRPDEWGLWLATSNDGVTFSPYDSQETREPYTLPYPDGAMYGADILPTETGWEMFYSFTYRRTGPEHVWGIGYAISEDGRSWTPLFDRPFLVDNANWWADVVVVDDLYYLYYLDNHDYADIQDIRMSTGTVTHN